MDEIKIPEAYTDKEKDAPSIIGIWAMPGMVLGGMAGFVLWGPMGAIIGAPLGAGLTAYSAYRFSQKKHIAKDMKFTRE